MNDYISREWLLAEYDRRHKGPPGGARQMIEEAPAADVRPVRWIPVSERLPDAEPGNVSERVLVTDGEDVAIVEWFNFEECGKFWGYTGFGKDVTH